MFSFFRKPATREPLDAASAIGLSRDKLRELRDYHIEGAAFHKEQMELARHRMERHNEQMTMLNDILTRMEPKLITFEGLTDEDMQQTQLAAAFEELDASIGAAIEADNKSKKRKRNVPQDASNSSGV